MVTAHQFAAAQKSLWKPFLKLFLVTGLTLLVVAQTALAETTPLSKPLSKKDRKVVATLKAAVADPTADVEKLTIEAMQKHPTIACALAKVALQSVPKLDGKPDARRVTALTKALVSAIVRGIPEARPEVICIVLSAIDALTPDGGRPDSREIAQLVGAIVPLLLEFAPELIDPLIAAILDRYPEAGPLVAQIVASATSVFQGGTGSLTRPEESVEPNLQAPATTFGN